MRDVAILILIAATALGQETQTVQKVGGHYEDGFVGGFYSNIDGKALRFGLTDRAANDQSVWKTSEKNPPVSVRDAIASARRKLNQLFPAKRLWTLAEVKLVPVAWTVDATDGTELWQYCVVFTRHSDPPNPHFPDTDGEVTIVVLMDGTAVDPIITDGRQRPRNTKN